MSKKPRSDSKLDALLPEQREQLASWLTVENLSYAKARARVLKEFKITTSAAALVSFYSRFAAPWKYAQAKDEADTWANLMDGRFDEATIKRAKELAFDSMIGPKPDLKTAKTLLKILGDSAKVKIAQDKLSLDARKVKLLEEKAARLDTAEGIVKDSDLTEAEKAQRLRSLFGMG